MPHKGCVHGEVGAQVLHVVITGKGNDILMGAHATVVWAGAGGPGGGGRPGVKTIRKWARRPEEPPAAALKSPVPRDTCFSGTENRVDGGGCRGIGRGTGPVGPRASRGSPDIGYLEAGRHSSRTAFNRQCAGAHGSGAEGTDAPGLEPSSCMCHAGFISEPVSFPSGKGGPSPSCRDYWGGEGIA